MIRILLLVVILIVCSTAAAASEKFKGECVAVVDGDTIKVSVWNFDPETRTWEPSIKVIRLDGVDAPELTQEFGVESKSYLSDLILGRRIEIEDKGCDWHGRTIGRVHLVDGVFTLNCALDVSADLVANGMAWWYRRFAPKDSKLRLYEEIAREDRKGLWSKPGPTAPWNYRIRFKRPALLPHGSKIKEA